MECCPSLRFIWHQVLSTEGHDDDHVVRLRRAEANRQLGRYEPANGDLKVILESSLDAKNIVVRKARKMKAEMRRVEKNSADELRGNLSKSFTSEIFSSERAEPEKKNDNDRDSSDDDEHPLLQRLHRSRDAERNKVPRRATPKRRTPTAPLRELSLETVESIQTEQLSLFSSAEVQKSLNRIRMDSDLEQDRFFYRLKPFKLEVQAELLKTHGFEPTEQGLASMERSVASHMGVSPEVGARGKELMTLIMGDVWL